MGFELVGKVWDPAGFSEYVRTLNLSWAEGITIHHTASPDHQQRPKGLIIQHIRNIQDFYQRAPRRWSSGPHLFTDEDQIFGMSSLERPGVHARSFNKTHIGIEVLGDYDYVDPKTDERGRQCWRTAARAAAILIARSGLSVDSINGHRDDPRTSKTCPGKNFDLDLFRRDVEILLSEQNAEDDRADEGGGSESAPITIDVQAIRDSAKAINWQADKIQNLVK
jgi:hypothetical protein